MMQYDIKDAQGRETFRTRTPRTTAPVGTKVRWGKDCGISGVIVETLTHRNPNSGYRDGYVRVRRDDTGRVVTKAAHHVVKSCRD